MLRRMLEFLVLGSLVLASCGNDSEGRTRNDELPNTSTVTSDTSEPVSDSSPDDPGAGNESDSDTSVPESFTENSIIIRDNSGVEGQGDGSTETSSPADVIEEGDGVGEFVLEAPEEDGARRIVSNRISICHAAGNGRFVEIAVDTNGLNGHGDHDGDVIPAPVGGCAELESASTTSTSTTTTSTTVPMEQNETKWLDETLANMRVGEYYEDGIASTGPGGVIGYIVANNSIMPPGLSLDYRSGRVSGIPTRAGKYSFDLYSNFWGCICGLSKSFSVTVEEQLEAEQPTWVDSGLSLLIEGVQYSDGVAASPEPNSYAMSGSLPDGLTFDAKSGGISGTPTREGSYTFTVAANYDKGSLAPLNITAVVTPSIAKVWVDKELSSFALNAPYSDGVLAKGGGYLDGTMRGVMGYIISSGALPNGVSLDYKSGRVTGTPTLAGKYEFSIYAGFWAFNGLRIEFSGEIVQEVTTTVADVVIDDVTDDTTLSTISTLPTTEVNVELPQQPEVSLVDVVNSKRLVAQVLPDDILAITCDAGCIQLLVNRVGLDNGTVFARVNSTEWMELDSRVGGIEISVDSIVTDIQVKVVADDGATYVMQGQTQREGVETQNSSSMSRAIWWLLLLLILLIAITIYRERRKQGKLA